MAEETMNMLGVSIEDFVYELEEQLNDRNFDPMIGIGKSGIGKTMSIYELTQKRNIGFCELRLVSLTETDLLGIPDTKLNEDGTKTTVFAHNDLLPLVSRDGEEGILVLDEITSAAPNMRTIMYQLLDSKRSINGYKLPPKWKVIALGNGPDDGGNFQGAEHALFSRCMCFRIEPDMEVWLDWAYKNNVHPSIAGFIKFSPEYFHKMNADDIASVFPCPRSWMALSKILNARESRLDGMDKKRAEKMIEMVAAGTVGAECSASFSTFYSMKETIKFKAEDILDGKCVITSGAKGNRNFKLGIPNEKGETVELTEDIQPKAAYLLIESIIKDLRKRLEGYDEDMDDDEKVPYLDAVTNICEWTIALYGNYRDLGTTLWTGLNQSIENFYDITDSEIDLLIQRTPELMDKLVSKISVTLRPK